MNCLIVHFLGVTLFYLLTWQTLKRVIMNVIVIINVHDVSVSASLLVCLDWENPLLAKHSNIVSLGSDESSNTTVD